MRRPATRRSNGLGQLYSEFATFYTAERCPFAPANPRRVFGLCLHVYQAYQRRMTPWQFMSVVYATLGFRHRDGYGLFHTFDPAMYNGKLRLEDHFVNLFKKKLWGKLIRSLKPKTDQGRQVDPMKYKGRPELGLLRKRQLSRWDCERIADVSEGLAQLDEQERAVLHLTYWADVSARLIGTLLGLDRRTIAKRQRTAFEKLRRFFGLAA